MRVKKVITCVFCHNNTAITVDSSYSLPLEKIMTLRNIIIIKSFRNKEKNN